MSIFDRLRRNRQESVLPDEVQKYYQTEQRQRRGTAFLLAVGALLVTVIIAAILFFGGRAIYNQIRGDKNDHKPNTSNINDESRDQQHQDSAIDESKPNSDNNNSQSQPQNQPQGSSGAPAPNPTPAPTTTPALGDTDTSLPHTGDPGM